MIVWILFLAAGIAILMAALFVGYFATKMAKDPPPPVFHLDEAYEWVATRLSDEVAATLTPDEARQILAWQVDYMKQKGAAVNGNWDVVGRESIASDAEIVDYILHKARENKTEFIPEQIYPVIQIQFEYLRAIGALSSPAN